MEPFGIRKYLRVMFFAGTFFASISSRVSFFACNILVFKLIYEGVSTCTSIYLYINFTLFTFEGLFILYLLITRRTTPRRIFREECSGEEHDAKNFFKTLGIFARLLKSQTFIHKSQSHDFYDFYDFYEFYARKFLN